MNGKRIVKSVISICFGLFIGLVYVIYLAVIGIILPADKANELIHISNIVIISALSIFVVIIFILFAFLVIREFNFIKLYTNELQFNGFSEDLYKAAVKRKNRNKKNKFSVGYVGSVNLISSYHALNGNTEEAIRIIEEIDLNELKEKMKIEGKMPLRDNLTTYFGLIDNTMSLYEEVNDEEKADRLFELFNPLYDSFIMKYDYLNNVLFETKFRYLILKGRFDEANSILDTLKLNEPFFASALRLNLMIRKKDFEKSEIEKEIKNAYELAEKMPNMKAYYKQSLDYRKKHLDELLKEAD